MGWRWNRYIKKFIYIICFFNIGKVLTAKREASIHLMKSPGKNTSIPLLNTWLKVKSAPDTFISIKYKYGKPTAYIAANPIKEAAKSFKNDLLLIFWDIFPTIYDPKINPNIYPKEGANM